MLPIQNTLYAVALFLALTSLLRWKHIRQSAAHRLKRSLRVYMMRRSSEFAWSGARLKAA
jgi:hypothetical protein